MLWAKINLQIARDLNVDVSTVYRVINKYKESGDVCKRRHPQGHDPHLKQLTSTDEFLIRVSSRKTRYLPERIAG